MAKVATLILRACPFEVLGDVYATETGVSSALDQGLKVLGAFGDFDSVSKEELKRFEQNVPMFIKVSSIKDESDSELAIKILIGLGYSEIYVYGALGQRVDHQHINLVLMNRFPQVILKDENQVVQSYVEGVYTLPQADYHTFSVFTQQSAQISLEGCKYPLEKVTIDFGNSLTLSNEWNAEQCTLTVHQGQVWVVKAKA